MKHLKVMFGLKSDASDFKYKLNEINEANVWNSNEMDPEKMGRSNFFTEDKILRWLVRGDTIYDVTIPDNAEFIDRPSPSTPHGVFRSNKIIISNPRKVTDEIAMDLYLKSDLPEKSYFKAMTRCIIRDYINTANKILNYKININTDTNVNYIRRTIDKFKILNFDEIVELMKNNNILNIEQTDYDTLIKLKKLVE